MIEDFEFISGILLGIPIGLTNDPYMRKEAIKEAYYGDVARYMFGKNKSKKIFGVPRIASRN